MNRLIFKNIIEGKSQNKTKPVVYYDRLKESRNEMYLHRHSPACVEDLERKGIKVLICLPTVQRRNK